MQQGDLRSACQDPKAPRRQLSLLPLTAEGAPGKGVDEGEAGGVVGGGDEAGVLLQAVKVGGACGGSGGDVQTALAESSHRRGWEGRVTRARAALPADVHAAL